MSKIKRFGDYPVGTLLEVPVSYIKTAVCRVEYAEDYRQACKECALNWWDFTGACLMFDCAIRDGKHKILKEVKQ